MLRRILPLLLLPLALPTITSAAAENTRVLRQPTLSAEHVAFTYGSDLWVVGRDGGVARRLTATAAVESDPHVSPDGQQVAFTSNRDGASAVYVVGIEGGAPRRLTWHPARTSARGWSPDGERIAFVEDDVRVRRVVEVESGRVVTVDVGGTNLERGDMGLTWSPDSQWLAYARTFGNDFRRIVVWSLADDDTTVLTNPLADSTAPSFDRDGRHLYFLASTDLALGSGWANTSSIPTDPTYAAWVMILRADDPTPFPLRSDEEEVATENESGGGSGDETEDESEIASESAGEAGHDEVADARGEGVRIDAEGIHERIVVVPVPTSRYRTTVAGLEGTVFLGERVEDAPGLHLHRFTLEEREAETFAEDVRSVSVSNDGESMIYRTPGGWAVVSTASPPQPGDGTLDLDRQIRLDRRAEWEQPFDEAWRYERDLFYDPGLHGADWDEVRDRYRPLVEHVRHRADLTYVLDQNDGGVLTAPDNAVFDPVAGEYVAENEGVPPDIEVRLDARSAAQDRDPQLERAVDEALRLLEAAPEIEVERPRYPRPARPQR